MREYEGDDALGFVLSLNLRRRHLTTEQKAVLALDVLPFQEQQAATRMQMGKERIPDPIDAGQARDKAAASVGVNPRYVIAAGNERSGSVSLRNWLTDITNPNRLIALASTFR